LSEWAHADYFLTYGEGIQPPAKPLFPLRAEFVPVGSARIASWLGSPRPGYGAARPSRRVLWVAETATRNVVNYALVEDTDRYLLERGCLELLAGSGLDVTFRPYPGQADTSGVLRWLHRRGLDGVRIDEITPLRRLIGKADIVVSDAASGTTWNEIIALGKPLVLFCDPETARLRPDFAACLAGACHWCRTSAEFVEALQALADGTYRVCRRPDVDRYLAKYVLHDGRPAAAVASLLERTTRELHPRAPAHG
jgi:hypothetical protein